MREEHENVSEAQLQNWWEMKQAGESRSSGSSSGGTVGEGYSTRGGDQFDVPQEAIRRVRSAREKTDDDLAGNHELAGTYTGTRQELPDGEVRTSPAGSETPDQPAPEPEAQGGGGN